MPSVPDLNAEEHVDNVVAVGALHRNIFDVGSRVRNLGGESGKKAALVVDEQPYPGLEYAFHLRCPLDVDDLIGVRPSFP